MEADPSATQTEPPEVPAPRLPRRTDGDRYLGGVAGGIASRFNIDPFVVRAGFLGTTLFAAYAADWVPIVPGIYTLLWLFLPGPAGGSVLRNLRHATSRREAVTALASFAVIAILLTRPVFGFALGLAALAWVLLSDDAPSSHSRFGPTVDSQMVQAQPDTDPSSDNLAASSRWGRSRRSEQGETLVSPFAAIINRPRRQPALWPLTLSLLAILAIGAAMADALLEPGLDPAIAVNGALIIVGGVLLLSAWRGRALWTVLLAIALLPAWIGLSVANVGRFEGYGSATYSPTAIPESGMLDYANGYGSMTIDLRPLAFDEGDNLALNIEATAGTVTVLAPPEVEVLLRSKIGFGTASFQGNGIDYFEYDREPFLDRFMIRRYNAHGQGCIDDYWSPWALLIDRHRAVGVRFADLAADAEEDIDAIVLAIRDAGLVAPELVEDGRGLGSYGYEGYADRFPVLEQGHVGPYRVTDEFGNEFYVENSPLPLEVEQQIRSDREPFQQKVQDRTWSYPADLDGTPCIATPPPADPATIEINATIGLGKLEVHHDQG